MRDITYSEAVKNASAFRAIGETLIYLFKGPFPWEHAVSVEKGGLIRSDMYVSVRVKAECPVSGLGFTWYHDLEKREANGKSYYEIDTEGCQQVTALLSGKPLSQWRDYLAECATKVRARGLEYQEIAQRQMSDAAKLTDLAAFQPKGETAP